MTLTLVLLAISAIANGAMDILQYRPSMFLFRGDWWHKRGKYAWNRRKWYTKYIFTMVSDGWHMFKFVNIFAFALAMAVNLSNNLTCVMLVALGIYTFIGVVFEISYNYIWSRE
ncbi:MAG TPA: hypothetical protein PL041_02250 [Melioribacteraceae bacterium]|nr:hypothetical protein [Melioribacteraceae bacterium]